MDFEEFSERLARCVDKWEEGEFIKSGNWTDPRIKAYLFTISEKCADFVPSIEECLQQLNDNEPEWTFLMAMADWSNKSIELENILQKAFPTSDGIKRETIQALLGRSNEDNFDNHCNDMLLSELIASHDQVLQLFALEELDCVELPELLPYESFIEQCLNSKNMDLANAALKVLLRTKNAQNEDIITHYQTSIEARMQSKAEVSVEIESFEKCHFGGDWKIVHFPSGDQTEEKKRSIFSGYS